MTNDEGTTEVNTTRAEPAEKTWPEPWFLRAWAATEMAIACVLLVVIFISVLWQVVGRLWPQVLWPGVSELGTYSLVVMTFLMIGYLIGRNGHITIQIIDYVVKGRAFIVVKVVSAICVAVICALLAREAFDLMRTFSTRRTSALELPYWILYLVPLIGFSSGVVRAITRIFTANRVDRPFNAAEAK
jgi:TRAP-type C4-dicarboxylate transport system permease small subunit